MKVQILLVALLSSLTACGQTQDPTYSKTGNIKIENKLDLSKITNGTVRKAIEALQQNDKKTWYSYFTENTVFTDDGRTLDFIRQMRSGFLPSVVTQLAPLQQRATTSIPPPK